MSSIRDRMQRPSGELLDAAAARSRVSVRARLQRVRTNALTIAQCALAAGLAWLVAKDVVGHTAPFFAPVAAILTLGLTFGQRGRRALELALGVAMGIGVGDVIVVAIGTGWWQITVVAGLAMGAAMLFGGGALLVNQAAVSAVLVATLQPPGSGLSGARFTDAVLGGALALLVNALVPRDPIRLVRREAEPVLAQLAQVLDDVAQALEDDDRGAAQATLERARSIDASTDRFREALDVGREMAILAPPRRRARGHLEVYAGAVGQIDHAVRNARVLARGAIRAIELDEHVPPRTLEAIRELAAAVRAASQELASRDGSSIAEEAALRAAALSTAALEDTSNLSASVIVGQVRSTAVDLLRGLGMDGDDATGAVREARARLGI